MSEMFEVFGAIRIINIYIYDFNLIPLKVVHPDDEEDLDVYNEFNEEKE